jgi:hypothetical protein
MSSCNVPDSLLRSRVSFLRVDDTCGICPDNVEDTIVRLVRGESIKDGIVPDTTLELILRTLMVFMKNKHSGIVPLRDTLLISSLLSLVSRHISEGIESLIIESTIVSSFVLFNKNTSIGNLPFVILDMPIISGIPKTVPLMVATTRFSAGVN